MTQHMLSIFYYYHLNLWSKGWVLCLFLFGVISFPQFMYSNYIMADSYPIYNYFHTVLPALLVSVLCKQHANYVVVFVYNGPSKQRDARSKDAYFLQLAGLQKQHLCIDDTHLSACPSSCLSYCWVKLSSVCNTAFKGGIISDNYGIDLLNYLQYGLMIFNGFLFYWLIEAQAPDRLNDHALSDINSILAGMGPWSG